MPKPFTLADRSVRDAFRKSVVDHAVGEIGYVEARVNRTKYGAWFGLDGLPWCAMFVSWCYHRASLFVKCENPLQSLQTAKGYAGSTEGWRLMSTRLASDGTRGWNLHEGEGLLPGDVVVWDHDHNVGGAGHTGIVVVGGDAGGPYDSVEGNTNDQFSRTGGKVCRHHHKVLDGKHGVLLGFARPTRRYGR